VYLIKLLSDGKASYECNTGTLDVLAVTAAGFMLGAAAKAPVQPASPLYK